MTCRFLRQFARGITQPARELGQRIDRRLQAARSRARRYLAALGRRPQPDPEREAIIEQALGRLQALHRVASRYLPGNEVEASPEETWLELEDGSTEPIDEQTDEPAGRRFKDG